MKANNLIQNIITYISNFEIDFLSLYALILLCTVILVTVIGLSKMDPLLPVKIDRTLFEKYQQDFKQNQHNYRHVDLCFWNAKRRERRLYRVGDLEERPSKIIFDKNDSTGALLFVIYNDPRYIIHRFYYNNVFWVGMSVRSFTNGSCELGTMERVDDNRYFISGPPINSTILQSLEFRNIRVTSGDLPITRVQHVNVANPHSTYLSTYSYIYGNRREAIGEFENDSVLPK